MFQANVSRASAAKQGNSVIWYPEDSGQALTTLHCNRKDAQWRRDWVVENKLPKEARQGYRKIGRQKWAEFHKAQAAVDNADRVQKFDAWYMGKGTWAYKAVLADGILVACEYKSQQGPIVNGGRKRFGTYRNPMSFFRTAKDVNYYIKVMGL